MKWKLNIVKNIVTPIEVETDDLLEAVSKAYKLIPTTDKERAKAEYMVDTTPSTDLIKWAEDKSTLATADRHETSTTIRFSTEDKIVEG